MKPVFIVILLSVFPGSATYTWQQMSPPGNGCFQDECVEGQWPMGIVPVAAFDDQLWMVGQTRAWSSLNGTTWTARPKADWQERISFPTVYFKGKLLSMGGLIYQSRTLANDIWASADGNTWALVKQHATWTPRKGHELVQFNDRLWLIGGARSVDEDRAGKDFINDVWVSDDGLDWKPVTSNAGFPAVDNPQVVVFNNRMWLLGGAGLEHVWHSGDGRKWERVEEQPGWLPRWENGALAFDDKLWIFGGHESDKRKAYNDAWYSSDGVHWQRLTEHAPWSARSGGASIVFNNQLWLFAGKHTGSQHNWNKDIWAMTKQ